MRAQVAIGIRVYICAGDSYGYRENMQTVPWDVGIPFPRGCFDKSSSENAGVGGRSLGILLTHMLSESSLSISLTFLHNDAFVMDDVRVRTANTGMLSRLRLLPTSRLLKSYSGLGDCFCRRHDPVKEVFASCFLPVYLYLFTNITNALSLFCLFIGTYCC